MVKKLIEAIEDYQDRRGLNDGQFARLIGIDPSTLSLVKRELRKPGHRFLGAVSQIPELKGICFSYLSEYAQQEPQDRGNGSFMKRLRKMFGKRHTRNSSTFSS